MTVVKADRTANSVVQGLLWLREALLGVSVGITMLNLPQLQNHSVFPEMGSFKWIDECSGKCKQY